MPPGLLSIRRTAAAAGLALTALPACPATATAGPAADCRDDQVTVVVDPNELGGATRVVCADHGGSAAELFESAGFPLTYTRAPGMQGFVCTLSGLPKDERCTQGDAYWSLWWSDGTDPAWAYATLGATSLEVEPGGWVGFAWHQGADDAAPPDVPISTADGSGDDVVEGAPEDDRAGDDPPAQDAVPTWVVVAGAVVVLGAAGAVPLLRRRRST